MSQVPSTTTSSISTNFETIFTAALESYKKQTKKDIASHPLAAQLQSRESPSAILAVLRAQVQVFDKSQSADEKLTKWLVPTVNVLYAFSAVLGDAVGLVIARVKLRRIYPLTCGIGIPTFGSDFCWDWCPPPSEPLPDNVACERM
jgi:hypothetical protein